METKFRQSRWILFQLLLPDVYEVDTLGIRIFIRRWFKPMNQSIFIQYHNIAAVEAAKSGKFGLRGWIFGYGEIVIKTNSATYTMKCMSKHKQFEKLVNQKIKDAKTGHINDNLKKNVDNDYDLL